MSLWLSGISVSRGIAIGPVHRVHTLRLDIPEYAVATNALDAEVARFEDALAQARAQLQTIRSQVPANAASEIGAFIETHLLMMQDSALTSTVAKLIRGRGCNAEWALQLQQDQLTDAFNQMEDAYLKQRAADVEHVTARIQRVLLKQERHIGPQPTALRPPPVMVADDLTPADIAVLHQQGVSAVICEHGGPLSHSAILARSLRIPAIMGVHGARRILLDGETAVVDGEAGHVLAAPDANALAFYHHRQKRDQRYRHMLGKLTGEPAISTDGVKVRLLANVELPEDSEHAAAVGAEGIGLYRTEFLYMNRQDCPSEEEQLAAYRQVLRSVDGPVTIRTLDLGADKTA
ncbi:MAG: phosphoenolpyruvate--protein phosphotransferase, partial [Salinisphaera sp.]|nr:phosphoenolpyruvate--protein phosphotransferase [Salinisphaera sp.]